MAINITSDYALRTMLYLAEKSDRDKVSGREICDCMKIPYNYFLKIIPNLKNAGFLYSFQGKNGGYTLSRPLDEISVYDVLVAMNDPIIVAHCLNNPDICSRKASDYCAVHRFFAGLQSTLDKELKAKTIADLKKES